MVSSFLEPPDRGNEGGYIPKDTRPVKRIMRRYHHKEKAQSVRFVCHVRSDMGPSARQSNELLTNSGAGEGFPGRMLHRWLDQFVAWHYARVSNRPTDAIDSLIKQVKRTSFGFRRLRNYTFRVMLCAGRSY